MGKRGPPPGKGGRHAQDPHVKRAWERLLERVVVPRVAFSPLRGKKPNAFLAAAWARLMAIGISGIRWLSTGFSLGSPGSEEKNSMPKRLRRLMKLTMPQWNLGGIRPRCSAGSESNTLLPAAWARLTVVSRLRGTPNKSHPCARPGFSCRPPLYAPSQKPRCPWPSSE